MIHRTTEAVMLAARIMAAPTAALSMAVEGIIDYESEFRSAWHCAGANRRAASPLRSGAGAGARPSERVVPAGVPRKLSGLWLSLGPLGVIRTSQKHQMPAGRRKPLEQCSNQEIRGLLIAGTTICLIIVAASFYANHQPDWFLWIGRCIAMAWMVQAWYRGLRELRKRGYRK
jgi:hypothetical protein